MLTKNVILNCDSYKISHWMFLEEGTTYSQSYIEARKGAQDNEVLFFGLQYILLNEFMTPVTKDMVDEAEKFLTAHGEPFNRKGWDYIVNEHGGFLPIRIKAVKEGVVVPVDNALVIVESTDPHINAVWAASYIETKLMRLWYPITVATKSRKIRKIISEYLEKTGDPSLIDWKLVDFGARGVSSKEQAMIGGAAHLINFRATDNILGMAMAMEYYGEKEVVGDSIPATEHSVTTSWGEPREKDFYENIVRNVLPKTGICSVVSDTYNLMEAIEMFGSMREQVEANGVIVVRPDSGDPVETTLEVVKKLDELFGHKVNDKGYKVLNDCVRIIQGDGIDTDVVKQILENFKSHKYSADNITFGSGGALLQKVNRDTNRFAMKACHVVVDGEARDIQKVPLTDPTKASKKGKLRLVKDTITGKFTTLNQHDVINKNEADMMDVVYENGVMKRLQTFSDIREIAKNYS